MGRGSRECRDFATEYMLIRPSPLINQGSEEGRGGGYKRAKQIKISLYVYYLRKSHCMKKLKHHCIKFKEVLVTTSSCKFMPLR